MSQPAHPPCQAASSAPRLGGGVLTAALPSPRIPPQRSTPPRVSAGPRGREQGTPNSRTPQAPTRNPPRDQMGGAQEGERSGAHSWPRRRPRRLPGVPRRRRPHACASPGRVRGGVGRGEGATSKPILISPIMSAGRRLEKASGTLNKKNVANAIIEGGSRRAGIASL